MTNPIRSLALLGALGLFAAPSEAQQSEFDRFLRDAERAIEEAQREAERAYREAQRAIDEAIAHPDDPTYGVLASRLTGAPVRDPSGTEVATIADFVVGPDGRVLLAILRIGGTFGTGGQLVAAEYGALTRVGDADNPAYVFEGDVNALPPWRVSGAN